MIRYRTQSTEPTWPDWSEPNTEHPTTFIPVGGPDDGMDPLAIRQLAFDPSFAKLGGDLWGVWEPAVDINWEGQANEAECRALAVAFLAAADQLAEITAEDNDYPLEQE